MTCLAEFFLYMYKQCHRKWNPVLVTIIRLFFLYRLLEFTWRCCLKLQVGWDESTAGERQPRVSLWEIEPLTTFPMYPSLFPLRLKRPWYPGVSSFQGISDASTIFISKFGFQRWL